MSSRPQLGGGEPLGVLNAVKRDPLTLPVACVVVLALISISEVAYWQSAHTLDRLGAMAIVTVRLQKLQWGVLGATAAQHLDATTTVASRQAQSLACGRAMLATAADLAALDACSVNQPQPLALLADLHRMTAAKLAWLPGSSEQMKAIRALSAELLQYESLHVEAGPSSLCVTLKMGRMGVATLSALELLNLFIALRQRMTCWS
ncbi:hypothetical protein ACG02S_11090 [Roseateles sp. DC23W]|uniref:Uncharacterized protein n=1 Tax=Pelomonas dachongensis TaxID=3299029 RepID=A0ABW7ELX3_9BURK